MRDWLWSKWAGSGYRTGPGRPARRCVRGRADSGRRGTHDGIDAAGALARLWIGGASRGGRLAFPLFLAAHSFLSLDEAVSVAVGMLMAVPAHAVGWPIPRGGSQSLTNALCRYLSTLGGEVKTSSRVESLASLSHYGLILCDVTPRQLLRIAGQRLSDSYKRQLERFRYGPGVFKVHYALNSPIPLYSSA